MLDSIHFSHVGGTAVERPGYRMLAAIVPAGEQLHFIKAYGPQKTMSDHEDAFHAFLHSLEKKE